MPADSRLTVAVLFPDLLGTYGDTGNARVLAQRARWRGIEAQILIVPSDRPVPTGCDIYLIGGGEDAAQSQATRLLDRGGFPRAVASGALVFAVCAGLQLLGREVIDAHGHRQPGLGLLDLTTRPAAHRAVGEVLTHAAAGLNLVDPLLTGFENHAGRTELGPGATPLGSVQVGTGNGDGTDGAVTGSILATYLHGPVLARNPALADHILSQAIGHPLPPLLIQLPDITSMRRSVLARHRSDGRHRLIASLTPHRLRSPGVQPATGHTRG